MKRRLLWLDALRGFAIVLMIVFHFCYDLRYFGWVDWNVPNGDKWWQFRYVIIALFSFTIGISLSLAHDKSFKKQVFLKRLVQLIAGALAVTVMSLFLFPSSWIYFGILHFIVVASIISALFIKHPKVALGLGLLILMGYNLSLVNSDMPFVWIGLSPWEAEDYVPLFPWLGVIFIGVGVARFLPITNFDITRNAVTKPLALMGKHGLIVYLVHQPLLFGGFLLVQMMNAG